MKSYYARATSIDDPQFQGSNIHIHELYIRIREEEYAIHRQAVDKSVFEPCNASNSCVNPLIFRPW